MNSINFKENKIERDFLQGDLLKRLANDEIWMIVGINVKEKYNIVRLSDGEIYSDSFECKSIVANWIGKHFAFLGRDVNFDISFKS